MRLNVMNRMLFFMGFMPVVNRIMLMAEPSKDKSSDYTPKIVANGEKSKTSAKDMRKENNKEVDSTVITTVAQIHYSQLLDTTSRNERNDKSPVESPGLPSSVTCGSSDIEKDLIVSNTLQRVNNLKLVDKKRIPVFTSTPIPGHHGLHFMKCKTREIDFDKISVYREPHKKKNLKNMPTKTNSINYGIKKMTEHVKTLAKSSSTTPKSSSSMSLRSNPNVPEDVKSSGGKKNKQVPAISSSANDPESEIAARRSRRKINPPRWREHMDCASTSSSKIGKQSTKEKSNKKDKKPSSAKQVQKEPLSDEVNPLVEKDRRLPVNGAVGKQSTEEKSNKKDKKPSSAKQVQKEPLSNEVNPLVEKDRRLPVNGAVGKQSTKEKSNKKDKKPSSAKQVQKEPLSDEVNPLVETDRRLPVNGAVGKQSTEEKSNKNDKKPSSAKQVQKEPLSNEVDPLVEKDRRLPVNEAVGKEEVLQKRPKLPERHKQEVLPEKRAKLSEAETKRVTVGSENEVLPEKRAKLSEAETKRVTVGSKNEGFRHSKRTRIKPLKYWLGERLIFKTGLDSCREVVGIELEQPIENNAINYAAPKRRKTTITSNQQKERIFRKVPIKKKETGFPLSTEPNLQKRELITVPYEGRDCKIECFSTLRSDNNVTEVTRSDVAVFSGIENQGMEAGYLQIVPRGKIVDSAHHGSVVFHVLSGLCTATIHGKSKQMKKGDIIFVPKDLEYKILNENFETVLSYTRFDTK